MISGIVFFILGVVVGIGYPTIREYIENRLDRWL